MTEPRAMSQTAPFPTALKELVEQVRYRPGWQATLNDLDRGQGSTGLTLVITTLGYNSYHPTNGETYQVNHYMTVPPAAYDRASWLRWLFEQFLLVERHECMEFFALAQTDDQPPVRPFAPNHGPGNDPYTVRELTTAEQRRTSFRGEMNPEPV